MSVTTSTTKEKEQISAHIAQLQDMKNHYPEAKISIQTLVNHLNGLRRVKAQRKPQKFKSLQELITIK
ncbi:hypothetical protein [Maribacter sp.]|uniref:hypothetical protein n=1 Tax=Maribacter sp. TaxID=1897614 RepID=UPI0025C4C7F3|nr:hypothetical protein [Maribacter sp.]